MFSSAGNTTFGAKPTGTAFGTPAFGAQTTQATGGLFGQTTGSTGGLFGGTQPAATGGAFGGASTGFSKYIIYSYSLVIIQTKVLRQTPDFKHSFVKIVFSLTINPFNTE